MKTRLPFRSVMGRCSAMCLNSQRRKHSADVEMALLAENQIVIAVAVMMAEISLQTNLAFIIQTAVVVRFIVVTELVVYWIPLS